ncbi:MAG: hypothetical protein L6Q74_20245 [Sphaerotilus natans subsp. sulfidivorans]|uniref:hypothetical protein n=1 Tax=Sphaerotilus sulfidivorans TaxID=639200 RepID=UPI0023532F00|nr:hypothetical protein [Sphaerotilus sulfidivorans]MCK6404207.1 hypothetical protein [Sphaerotilus sulfidivorans]
MKTPNNLLGLLLAAALAVAPMATHAHRDGSEASVLSALSLGVPLAISAAPAAALLSAGATLTVASVQVAAAGTVWVLTQASTGASVVLTLSAAGAEAVSVTAGTAVVVTALSAGWILSAAGKALCFVPNEIGLSLIHNERMTR